ncbi:GNAT family N-acetyltransferase [Anoxynatronum buryatiense]|uniref:Acetyltransferase n=1 Tax=Anoxynatronum buryatiense TaxID=489973 RepID=A0AA46AIU9_9CLOT|nr:N-acetyltransferase [Anoxynatronum buryatiense]SMP54770.1 putative acetyltransferase [Anoxynatronum buryatiense]
MAKPTSDRHQSPFRITCRELVVRPENKKEVPVIREVVREAFHPMPFSTGREWKLVEEIRQSPGYLPSLSLVALCDGMLVGHSIISLIEIEDKKKPHNALVLGPVSILPDFQRRGIGQELIRIGIVAAKRMPLPAMVVVGDPAYYSRFGFEPAVPRNIHMPFGFDEEDYLQVLELKKGALKGVQGVIKFPPSFFDEKGDLL